MFYTSSWLHREREITCHGINLFYEARNQSRAGQIGVLDVVSNRVNHSSFPSTFCRTIQQYRAFSWYLPRASKMPREELHWKDFAREEFKDNPVELRALSLSLSLAKWHYMVDPPDTTSGAIYFMTLPAVFSLSSKIESYNVTIIEEDHLFFSSIKWR